MRVLHVDAGREMRGGQWQAFLLHQQLFRDGHHTLLICPEDSALYQQVHQAGLPVEPLKLSRWPAADLVHAHDARAHTLAAVRGRRPLIISRRVAFPIRQSIVSQWKYRRKCQRFLAISQFVRGVLWQGGVPSDRVSVVYDGVALPPVLAHGDTIVATATADSMKGSRLLAEAAQIAGFDVRFSTDLPTDLAQAGLFVYLSQSEGLGSAALLAAAYGVSVLASDVGGLPEAIENGRTGILVRNEPAEVASAIRELMADPARRRQMGEAGRRMVEQRFTVEMMVQATISNYQAALA